MSARIGASVATAANLSQLVVHSLREYESLGVRLGGCTRRDSALHAQLRTVVAEKGEGQNRTTAPLYDTAQWVRHYERALQVLGEAQELSQAQSPMHIVLG
jgi:predicted O-linked N-acetylglucosamine transferase (SPINDLY family)